MAGSDRANRVVGIIGGTGLGQALTAQTRGEVHRVETPFGPPSAPIVRTRWDGVEIAFLMRHGEGHVLPPPAVPYRANIFALKSLGCTHILASGATGSLREEIVPGHVVIPDQVIDKTHRRAASFFDQPGIAAHVELSHPFCPTLRTLLLSVAGDCGTTVHDGGTYVCMEGPAFSTIAESRMHRAWGGDLIGMTCMPEARLAREAEMCYALIALPTDYDCWRPHDPAQDRHALLREILSNMEHATTNAIELLRAALRKFVTTPPPPCACQTSLDLAIWTAIDRIERDEIRRLGPILARRLAEKS
ncbi:MAG: S-methyl-5'-thioadenosine phosphorylase [Phycisphaerae bacterium]|nr:S-methyl-5'-thioadenosine phosphorylase [Phycisphaerae bacterium]